MHQSDEAAPFIKLYFTNIQTMVYLHNASPSDAKRIYADIRSSSSYENFFTFYVHGDVTTSFRKCSITYYADDIYLNKVKIQVNKRENNTYIITEDCNLIEGFLASFI